MSSFKKLSKADITNTPYAANKQWNLPYTCPSISNSYFNIYKGTYTTGTFCIDNYSIDPITNGQYERLVYDSINHLFYQSYTDTLNTGSLMFNINTYESASEQRPTGSYFNYNINPNLIKNFPTGAGAGIRVLAINQEIYGSKVLPSSFNLSSSLYNIKDDGNGNLYNGSENIGNIFYAHGLAVITNPDYQLMFPLPPIANHDIATFPSSDTGSKIISVLQNDVSRSCILDTGSIVLSGDNSSYYTVMGNGTIRLNTSSSGNYDVYYTVNSTCGTGCSSITSNKAKVTTNVTQVDPPPPGNYNVDIYGRLGDIPSSDPDVNIWYNIGTGSYNYLSNVFSTSCNYLGTVTVPAGSTLGIYPSSFSKITYIQYNLATSSVCPLNTNVYCGPELITVNSNMNVSLTAYISGSYVVTCTP